jgi:hypothetical protein
MVRFVSGDIKSLVCSPDEDDKSFSHCLEDWNCKSHQIITWFHNTIMSSIHL